MLLSPPQYPCQSHKKRASLCFLIFFWSQTTTRPLFSQLYAADHTSSASFTSFPVLPSSQTGFLSSLRAEEMMQFLQSDSQHDDSDNKALCPSFGAFSISSPAPISTVELLFADVREGHWHLTGWLCHRPTSFVQQGHKCHSFTLSGFLVFSQTDSDCFTTAWLFLAASDR